MNISFLVTSYPEMEPPADVEVYNTELYIRVKCAVKPSSWRNCPVVDSLRLDWMSEPDTGYARFRVQHWRVTAGDITPEMALDALLHSGLLDSRHKPPTLADVTVYSKQQTFVCFHPAPPPGVRDGETVDLDARVGAWTRTPPPTPSGTFSFYMPTSTFTYHNGHAEYTIKADSPDALPRMFEEARRTLYE